MGICDDMPLTARFYLDFVSYNIGIYDTGLSLRVHAKKKLLISQQKHVVGTQKNRLKETILLSTQNIC